MGLLAPLAVFGAVCQQHEFERNQVPLAEQHGWPRTINWDDLEERVIQQKGKLERIIHDVDEEWSSEAGNHGLNEPQDEDTEDEDELLQQERPRKGSIFWKDVLKRISAAGLNGTSGVRSQLANFSKVQPG